MEPGALLSGENTGTGAALSLLSQGRAPASKGRSAPARAFLLGEITRGDVSRGLEISTWSLVDCLGGTDGSGSAQ